MSRIAATAPLFLRTPKYKGASKNMLLCEAQIHAYLCAREPKKMEFATGRVYQGMRSGSFFLFFNGVQCNTPPA